MRYLVLLLLFISSTCISEETTRPHIAVSAAHWKAFTNIDDSGIYYELIDAVYDEYDIKYQTSTYPRALNQFKANNADIVVGVYQHELPDAHYANWILDTDLPIHIFYRADETLPENEKVNFKGKKVAWRAGYGFSKFFPDLDASYSLDNIEAGFTLLVNKRIDYVLDYEENFVENYRGRIHHQVIREGEKLYLAFRNSVKGRKLAAQFDRKMSEFRENGTLAHIYGEHYSRSELASFSDEMPLDDFSSQ
mgnify:CR=1 FL=1